MPNNFDQINNELFLDVTLNGKVLRYYLTGFDGSDNNNFDTALDMVTRAYILNQPGFAMQPVVQQSPDQAIIHFTDDNGNPGKLFLGVVTGNHITSKAETLKKLKQQAREQLNFSPLSLSEINLEIKNPLIEKKANIFINIAPSGLAISDLVQQYQQQSHEAREPWYYTRMGTEGLSKKTLEDILKSNEEDVKKKTYGARTSYNDRNGDSQYHIDQAKGLFGTKTLHVKSGSTRGNEVYFTEGLLRNWEYSKFRSVVANLMQPFLEIDANHFSKNTDYQNLFRDALKAHLNEYTDTVVDSITDKELTDLFAGFQNIDKLLSHLEERFGSKLAKIFYDSIDASDYGAFWAHDLHAINASKLLLIDENVTQLGTVVFSTDLFKDCDDFLVFLMVNEEFLLDGTFGGIPCESMHFYAAADVLDQRLKGMNEALALLTDELKNKYPEKANAIEQRLINVRISHGFDAASTELSHFTTKNATIMPCNAQKQPAINLGGACSFYLRQSFEASCDSLGINLNEIDNATESYYHLLHCMWNLNFAEFNQAHPNSIGSSLPEDQFNSLQIKLRAHINGQYTKAEKAAGLVLNNAHACDVIKTVFTRLVENDLEPMLGLKRQNSAISDDQSLKIEEQTNDLSPESKKLKSDETSLLSSVGFYGSIKNNVSVGSKDAQIEPLSLNNTY